MPSIAAFVQGKPVARRGRKARDLVTRMGCQTARPPAQGCNRLTEVRGVKANLARFTVALTLLASIAMSLGAGVKWL